MSAVSGYHTQSLVLVLMLVFVVTIHSRSQPYERCYRDGVMYEDGEDIGKNTPCEGCKCDQGTIKCLMTICPGLRCDYADRVVPAGECCPVCQNGPY